MINFKKYLFFFLGCEDIIVESILLDILIVIFKWSFYLYGFKWVYR